MISLLRSGITGEKQTLPTGFQLQAALDTICRQQLQPLAYQGAVNCGIPDGSEAMARLLKASYVQMVRNERQIQAAERIFCAFDSHGIDYMPLKGCRIRDLYPKPGLRLMTDADVLIRLEQYERIVPILKGMGFSLQGESGHEIVWHSDSLHLELHKCLFPPTTKDFYVRFGDGWDLAVKQQGTRYALRPEDEFLFLFAHMAGHYRTGGVGCRHILDLYVYRRKYTQMDEGYIGKGMAQLHLTEFYGNICRLLKAWFEDGTFDERVEAVTAKVCTGGSWGDLETRTISEELARVGSKGEIRKAKRKLALWCVFLPLDNMRVQYRTLDKAPFLLPVFWVVRWGQVLTRRPENIRRRIAGLKRMTDEKALARRKELRFVGLDFHYEEE